MLIELDLLQFQNKLQIKTEFGKYFIGEFATIEFLLPSRNNKFGDHLNDIGIEFKSRKIGVLDSIKDINSKVEIEKVYIESDTEKHLWYDALKLKENKTNKKILLIGVTFALLDFAEQFPMNLSEVVIMETGGMKGRRKEMMREEVHAILKQNFNAFHIHSEYGMTELLSQGYSAGEGVFKTPPWMKILKRDIYNPLQVSANIGRGALNVIDLANIYSCAFIATQDLVNIISDTTFEIIGRTDNSDIRGCNLMVAL